MSHNIDTMPMHVFAEKAYLDYAMYVILDRALPHVADGLKPVNRRIVYAMSELGLKSTAKYKKSARTIGDVLGKFHPHGDSACYEAMVLMAQSFSYRYTLVDGQGNWGSIDDPKSFAAMRYTEARLTPYAQSLLQELGLGTCNWVANFDGTLDEPERLPARLPNVLLNGAMGIAVGMATDIPPHNIHDVVNVCVHLLKTPDASCEDLCSIIQGPDYPSGGVLITPQDELVELYSKGKGSLKVRAKYVVKEQKVVITELPYQVSSTKIMQQIAEQMQSKKLPMLVDLLDQSDEMCPVRIVLILKSNRVNVDELMSHLFATTELQKQYRANLNMIGLNNAPKVMSLKEICTQWLQFRQTTIVKRLNHRLAQVQSRLHLLDGLLIAYFNLDEVIRIVRESDDPETELMSAFKLTQLQAVAILNIRLRQLAKLEQIALETEKNNLLAEEKDLLAILSSDRKIKTLMQKELLQDAKFYGDERRTDIQQNVSEAKVILEKVIIEPVTLILSQHGWIRVAKGHVENIAGFGFKANDSLLDFKYGKSNYTPVIFDETGRSYSLSQSLLPSARTHGEPLTKYLKLQGKATQVVLDSGDKDVLLLQDSGFGFVATYASLLSKNKAGKSTVSLNGDSRLTKPICRPSLDYNLIAIITSDGYLLIFDATLAPVLSKGKGSLLISIPKSRRDTRSELITGSAWLKEGSVISIVAGKRQLKLKPQDWSLFLAKKGSRGQLLPRGFRQVKSIEVLD